MLWGSRFNKSLDQLAMEFSSSLKFDINLFEYDILVSKAHVKMLCECEIISNDEKNKILAGLDKTRVHFRSENWIPDPMKCEDIHSAIEMYLTELIGETAGKLHTARSRNDLVVTSMRLWMKDHIKQLSKELITLISTIKDQASKNLETIMPGYTHLQRAQPVSFGYHLLTYKEMFNRDLRKIESLLYDIDEMPLGSGALAGSTLKINRKFTANELGFSRLSNHSMDAVSNRDFILDFLNISSVCMMHLSRLAEELILWSSSEFDFVKIDDKYTTGSSLMPQKKNPDMAELIRGKTGRVYGNQFSVLSMMKALPLAYNRDMQEDKEPVFDSYEVLFHSVKIMSGMLETININKKRFINELEESFILSTDIADQLVELNIPFREAHKIVGSLVKYCEENKKGFRNLKESELEQIHPELNLILKNNLSVKNSLKNKQTIGSPNPEIVLDQLKV